MTMIREFIETDLCKIDVNDFGEGDLMEKMKPVVFMYEGWTLEKDGRLKAILFYRQYAQGNYEGFLVCSVYMSAFDGQQVKEFIDKLKIRLNIERIETLSLDCESLNKWHRFLGFTCEGTKRRFLHGKDYKMWSMLRGE